MIISCEQPCAEWIPRLIFHIIQQHTYMSRLWQCHQIEGCEFGHKFQQGLHACGITSHVLASKVLSSLSKIVGRLETKIENNGEY